MRTMDPAFLSELAGLMMEGATQDDGLATAMDTLARGLDAQMFHLLGWDRQHGSFLSLQSPVLQEPAEDYHRHWGRLDPRRPLLEDAPEGTVKRCDEVLDARAVDRSAFYQDFLLDWDLRWVMGGPVLREGTRTVFIALNRTTRQGPFNASQAQGLRLLMPALRGAVRLQRESGRLRQAARDYGEALQAWGKGVLLLDGDGQLRHANTEAMAWIGPAGLFQLAGRQLVPAHPQFRRALQQLRLTGRPQAYTRDARHGRSGRRAPVTLTLLPATSTPASPRDGTVVLLESLEPAAALEPAMLRERFGLSQAEARVAQGLSAGLRPADIARQSGCGLATVRTHVRRVLEKTGSDGLQGLQRLLASLPRVGQD